MLFDGRPAGGSIPGEALEAAIAATAQEPDQGLN